MGTSKQSTAMLWVVSALGFAGALSGCDQEGTVSEAAGASPAVEEGSSAAPSNSGSKIHSVRELMRGEGTGKVPLVVRGVVSATSDDQSKLALIDRREVEQCKSLQCAKLTLPVEWDGEMPKPGQTVRVEGDVGERPEGKLFVARGVSVVAEARKF